MAVTRKKEATRPLPQLAEFPIAYFNAVAAIVAEARSCKDAFTHEVREYEPPGAKGKPGTTGEETERRNLQRFLQVLRTTTVREIPTRIRLLGYFKELDAQRRITTKTHLRENYQTSRLVVVSSLVVGTEYNLNLAVQEDN